MMNDPALIEEINRSVSPADILLTIANHVRGKKLVVIEGGPPGFTERFLFYVKLAIQLDQMSNLFKLQSVAESWSVQMLMEKIEDEKAKG